ncbi:MAG: NAD(P)-binding domain-containing protein, partial [Armatimonadetes bacterium]|nr:NAD(P)-binding domain-containing protein [Armatimonadota bacterium]
MPRNSYCTIQVSVAVLGSGSWGTALSVLLAKKGCRVNLWGIPEEAESIARYRENRRYLPGVKLPEAVRPTSDMDEALANSEAVILAIPSTGVREVARLLKGKLSPDILLVNAGKGLESETGLRGSQVISEELGCEIGRGCVALSGPNLAVELANDVPTATVVACSDSDRAAAAQELFWAPNLRVYSCLLYT